MVASAELVKYLIVNIFELFRTCINVAVDFNLGFFYLFADALDLDFYFFLVILILIRSQIPVIEAIFSNAELRVRRHHHLLLRLDFADVFPCMVQVNKLAPVLGLLLRESVVILLFTFFIFFVKIKNLIFKLIL